VTRLPFALRSSAFGSTATLGCAFLKTPRPDASGSSLAASPLGPTGGGVLQDLVRGASLAIPVARTLLSVLQTRRKTETHDRAPTDPEGLRSRCSFASLHLSPQSARTRVSAPPEAIPR